MTDTYRFVRMANPSKDCVAVGNVTTRGCIVLHSWKTGHQELYFPSIETALARVERSNGAIMAHGFPEEVTQ